MLMINKLSIEAIVGTVISKEKFTFTYKNGKGNFSIYPISILNFNQKDFRKFVSIIEISDDKKMVASYVNLIVKNAFNEVSNFIETMYPNPTGDKEIRDKKELTEFTVKMSKFHDILGKNIDIAPLKDNNSIPYETPVKEATISENTPTDNVSPLEANEIMTELKRCNVHRLIPTQTNPVWDNCKMETKIGYSFEYRGMPLQIVTDKGWVDKSYQCRIFVIDPVIGLPMTNYEGTLENLEDKLSEVFINYLKTIESNKEFIVQVAKSFEKLKKQVA